MTRSIRSYLGLGLLKLTGWRLIYQAPSAPKAVVIFYPHTSNWDFVIGIFARAAMALPIHFAAKDNLFRWPLAPLFRALGGIPVNRRKHTGLVAQLTQEFDRSEHFYIVIAPEGTRRYTDCWKSGFYHLALAARVPLALGFIDYRKREIGIQGYLSLSGNEAADLAAITAAYQDRRGKYPQRQGRIAFAHRSTQEGQPR